MNTFWVIWRDGGGPPTVKHFSRGQAEVEAERLARENPGSRFILLEAKGACIKTDVFWQTANGDPDDIEIPF